jgi:hypothetical protein
MSEPVKRRAVFFIGGYEPKSPQAFFNRLSKQLSRADSLWQHRSIVSPAEVVNDEIGVVSIGTTALACGWSTETDFSFLSLDKIVLTDFARPLPLRLASYLRAFSDFVISGAAFKFFAKAWRFGLYFIYPFVALIVFALLGYISAYATAPWIGVASWIVALVVFAIALAILGDRWSTNHLMDLWSFSLDFIRGRRRDADALLQRYAEHIVKRVSSGNYDEVILVGHSTGGLLMIDVAARCLSIDAAFVNTAGTVSLLTLGSTALKAGYHPAATEFRNAVGMLCEAERLEWVEIQCLTDPINFYKIDPVAELGIKPVQGKRFPVVRTVKVRDMVERDVYVRIRRNFFRVHYQYVFANSKPYWYDFFQICCGPLCLGERVEGRVIGSIPTREATPA